MDTNEILEYYASLLILQYQDKPRASETIKAVISPLIADFIYSDVRDGFNLTGDAVAVGVQLDTLGKYLGVSRLGNSLSGDPITLNDEDFRQLLLFASLSNSAGSSFEEIKRLMFEFFGAAVEVYDYQNMRMSYAIDPILGTRDLVEVLLSQKLLLRPMAVGLAGTIYAPIDNGYFGYSDLRGTNNAQGFNEMESYDLNNPWLSFNDII